jgi:hypothetical protein
MQASAESPKPILFILTAFLAPTAGAVKTDMPGAGRAFR